MCGERTARIRCGPRACGSSPRVRGTRNFQFGHALLERFIPACAGNASAATRPAPARPVHPRVCGERVSCVPAVVTGAGSSPRVRGTRRHSRARRRGHRFIPACAGNADGWRNAYGRMAVHPRVCGERPSAGIPTWASGGSSPRVRGTPVQRPPTIRDRRFIPACAGNASSTGASRALRTVHPRVCGERRGGVRPGAPHGSSPRVRGTPRGRPAGRSLIRFIPACAGNAAARPTAGGAQTVHPRVCGERGIAVQGSRPAVGSSPRVRGTPALGRGRVLPRRFIPACAGNAIRRRRPPVRAAVHPRVCGERVPVRTGALRSSGSSPRVRGTLVGGAAVRAPLRFIPACAGNAPRPSRRRPPSPVHPRVCGERWRRTEAAEECAGSSPRVRGTPAPAFRSISDCRFIPACAGNAIQRCPWIDGPAVHPRVCGERIEEAERNALHAGSSPRVRGTRHRLHGSPQPQRFIPACAGNASSSSPPRNARTVHPRVCGERASRHSPACMNRGSSPRVRGTRIRASSSAVHGRFIPACAGNAPLRRMISEGGAVHPRVCGERDVHRANFPGADGSSPRVRGTPAIACSLSLPWRFIPACAGNAFR